VNLCVTAEPLYRFWTGKPLPRNPATAGWPIQVRLGDVCPEGHDRWWNINSRTNIEKIGEDVSRRLTNYAVPFFDRFDTIDDIRKSILSDNPPAGFIEAQIPLIEAMFHTLEGNLAHAATIIEAQRAKWDGHPFLTTVTTIGDRLLEPTNG